MAESQDNASGMISKSNIPHLNSSNIFYVISIWSLLF